MARVQNLSTNYIVRRGDTLYKIAKNHYGDPGVWPQIAHQNKLKNPSKIYEGQRLLLPSTYQLNHPTLQPIGGYTLHPNSLLRSPKWLDAYPVAFPAFEYDLDRLPKQTVYAPPYRITLAMKGKITIQKKGFLTNFTVNKLGQIEVDAKNEATSTLSNLAQNVKITFDPKKNDISLSCGLTSVLKMPGGGTLTHKLVVGYNSIKFVCEPTPVKGETWSHLIEGTLGYEVEVELDNIMKMAPVYVENYNERLEKLLNAGLDALVVGLKIAVFTVIIILAIRVLPALLVYGTATAGVAFLTATINK